MVTDLVTREREVEMKARNGDILSDPGHDLLKIAAVDRTFNPGKRFVGLIQGFGLAEGAMASSASWDCTDIIVVGKKASEMALAVNRVAQMKGGAVISREERIVAEIPLPLFGILSQLPLEVLAGQLKAFTDKAHGLGIPFPNPLLTLITLTGGAIPFLRICSEGLVNLKDGKRVPLFVDEGSG